MTLLSYKAISGLGTHYNTFDNVFYLVIIISLTWNPIGWVLSEFTQGRTY